MFKRVVAGAAFATGVYLMVIEGADWGIGLVFAGVIAYSSGSGRGRGSVGYEHSLSDFSVSDSGDGGGGDGGGGGGD